MKLILCLVVSHLLLISGAGLGDAQDSAQPITIHAKRFAFQPSEITIYKGETVKLDLTSDDVAHSLVVEGLNINTPITKGHITEISVTPDKTGDFKGKCGRFCGTGHGSMRFVVHVVSR
jgi:cytochrome c oxidase subunit II